MNDADRHRARLDVVDALLAAQANVHEVVDIVASAPARPEAAARLRERFGLSAAGADAVLDMQLQRLTAIARDLLADEREQALRRLG